MGNIVKNEIVYAEAKIDFQNDTTFKDLIRIN